MGELVEVGHRDRSGLHAAHRETRHGPMRLIGDSAEIGVDVGDQVVEEKVLEGAEVEAAASTGSAPTGAGGSRRSGLGSGRRRGWNRRRRSRTASAGCAGHIAIGHYDNERLGFAGGDQVVHDQTSEPLGAPAGFVFPAAVLQIQDRISC